MIIIVNVELACIKVLKITLFSLWQFIVDEAKFNEDTLHITAERFGAEEFEEEESITNRTIGSLQPASGKLLSTLIQKSDMIAQLSCNAERTCYPPIVHLTSRVSY